MQRGNNTTRRSIFFTRTKSDSTLAAKAKRPTSTVGEYKLAREACTERSSRRKTKPMSRKIARLVCSRLAGNTRNNELRKSEGRWRLRESLRSWRAHAARQLGLSTASRRPWPGAGRAVAVALVGRGTLRPDAGRAVGPCTQRPQTLMHAWLGCTSAGRSLTSKISTSSADAQGSSLYLGGVQGSASTGGQ